jgi:SAM-dependent methyltransferase
MSSAVPFDKYAAYSATVQSAHYDARFLRRVYRELKQREPIILREDFCSTFELCCEWAKLDDEKQAIGLDIDPEPLDYGRSHYLAHLPASTRDRVQVIQKDVLAPGAPRADIVCALNFSYFAFRERETLLKYFRQCRRALKPGGIFALDLFGGPQYGEPWVDTKAFPGLKYFFQQEFFDPISNYTRFHIHFKPRGKRTQKRVFTYDWRMWSIPEVRDVMLDAGFDDVAVYWEGTGRNGRGSGKFHRRERGESCSIWVAYVVGVS